MTPARGGGSLEINELGHNEHIHKELGDQLGWDRSIGGGTEMADVCAGSVQVRQGKVES